MKILLWIAAIIGIGTYLFWGYMPKGSFYIGNSLFILLLCLAIFIRNRTTFIAFFLLCGAINNFLDELLFTPTKLGYNELALFIVLPAIWLYKTRNEQTKLT